MLTKNAKIILKTVNLSAEKKMTFSALCEQLKWSTSTVESACDHLISEGYAAELRKQYTSGSGPVHGIILTEKGRNWKSLRFKAGLKIILLDVLLPIVVSIVTTLLMRYFV